MAAFMDRGFNGTNPGNRSRNKFTVTERKSTAAAGGPTAKSTLKSNSKGTLKNTGTLGMSVGKSSLTVTPPVKIH
jgi:hypothetical protein